jgi:hypothetical protein
MFIARRRFLKGFGIAAFAPLTLFTDEVPTSCRRANGAGSYALGPFQAVDPQGDPVFLMTDLGFDETMAYCKVTTNFAPFRFPTATMGTVDFGAHEFFMDMQSVSVNMVEIEDSPDGPVLSMSGILRSETRLFSGSRTVTYIEENISFGCEAGNTRLDPSIEISPRNFVMTANFDPLGDHAAIFGANARFGGTLTQGNIIIVA